jgi:hypothetical protein
MAWLTTDTDVATTLTVHKTVNDQPLTGYPKTYSILGAFNSFAVITVDEWHKMTVEPRNERIIAFKAYIHEIEDIDVNTTQTNDVYRESSETPGEIVEE